MPKKANLFTRVIRLNTHTQLRVAIAFSVVVSFAAQPSQSSAQVYFSPGVALSNGVAASGADVKSGTWSDLARKATLAVGIRSKDQFGKDRFSTGGAAVLVSDVRGRIFIVTARHVFDNPADHWAPDTLQIRGWKDERTSRYEDFGSTLRLRDNGRLLFVESTWLYLAAIVAPQDVL
jgi:hypothetical protein